MSDPTLALHSALIAKLKEILDVPVYDAVPQGAAYPYVTIDSIATSNADYTTLRVTDRFVYLGIWSRAYGQAEIMGIMGKIDALDDTDLALSAGHVTGLVVDRMRTVREPDNLTYQGQVTLRITTQH